MQSGQSASEGELDLDHAKAQRIQDKRAELDIHLEQFEFKGEKVEQLAVKRKQYKLNKYQYGVKNFIPLSKMGIYWHDGQSLEKCFDLINVFVHVLVIRFVFLLVLVIEDDIKCFCDVCHN